MGDRLGSTVHTAILLTSTAILSWLFGLPLLFPSLGPSAFVLAMFEEGEATRPARVFGGHAIGVVAGLFAYHLLAGGVTMTGTIEPASLEGLRLAVSGIVATTLTAGGMLATDLRHPPACATTLIVSLGLLTTVFEAGLILAAVALMLVVHGALIRIPF